MKKAATIHQNQFTEPDIWAYCLEHTTESSKELQALTQETKASVYGAQMLSETMVTKLLQFFVRMQNPSICVDIGTYTGLSALAMAEVSREDAKIYTIDKKNQAGHDVAQRYIDQSQYTDKIKLCLGDANDIIPTLPQNIDFVFIDADKKQTQNYFDLLGPKLSDKAMLIVDDVLWRGEVLSPQDKRAKALDEFNRCICHHPDFDNVVLPIRHGLHLICKK